MMHYPWLDSTWQQLMQQRMRLPHAILLKGRVGIGKHNFAVAFAKAMLCRSPAAEGHACGHCQSCNWFEEGTHPDYKWLTPENDEPDEENGKKSTKRKIISVAQIRQLTDFISLTSHQSGLKVIVLSPAEALNTASANALLKMLEEPPPGTLFVLVASQPQRLLPTIISRCHTISLPIPDTHAASSWLQMQGVSEPENWLAEAGGAPLLAAHLSEQSVVGGLLLKHLAQGGAMNPFATASEFLSIGMEPALQILQKWAYDLQRCRLTQTLHYFPGYRNAFQALSKSVNLSSLMQFQRVLGDAKRVASHPLNNELQLENILLQYIHLFKP
jgi:DNA polymerase-3 subunit delta'